MGPCNQTKTLSILTNSLHCLILLPQCLSTLAQWMRALHDPRSLQPPPIRKHPKVNVCVQHCQEIEINIQCELTSVIHVDFCYCAGRHVSARYMSDTASMRRPPPSQSGRGKATPLNTSLYKAPKSKTNSRVSAVYLHCLEYGIDNHADTRYKETRCSSWRLLMPLGMFVLEEVVCFYNVMLCYEYRMSISLLKSSCQ